MATETWGISRGDLHGVTSPLIVQMSPANVEHRLAIISILNSASLEEVQRHGTEPEESSRFDLEEEMDSSGRMLLPPQARFTQPIRARAYPSIGVGEFSWSPLRENPLI